MTSGDNGSHPVQQPTGRVDVIVVGAGLAGLTAAHAVSRDGRSVVCLEARDRVGGRAVSIEVGGGVVDLGASWIWSGEPLVHSLAAQLGVRLHPQSIAGDALLDRGETPQQLSGNPVDVASNRFSDGAQELADRLAATLPPEVIRLGEPVTTIRGGPSGVQVGTADATYEADHVVVALPPALAVDTIDFVPPLPDDVRRAAAGTSVWMGDVVKAVAVYDQAFWRAAGRSGAAVSHRGPFVEFHDHSGPDHEPAALFAFGPADAFVGVGIEAVAEGFRAQLHRVFGEQAGQPTQLHVCDWSRERFTTPAGPGALPARQGFGHPALQRATLGGRISWASTETATVAAGHLEGAIHAGLRAARALLDDQAYGASSLRPHGLP